MIVVKLMGGHSNQLFQYAAGRRLAIKQGTKLYLDLSWFDEIPEVDTPREYELGVYPLEAEIADMKKLVVRDPANPPSLYERLSHRLKIDKRIWPIYQQGGQLNNSVLHAADNTLLVGFWQNEGYFKDVRDVLVKEFEPTTPLTRKNQKILERIQSTESVWIHVRRGDYVTNKHAHKHHGLTGLDYYKKALGLLTKKLPEHKAKNLEIFVCSNDITWCKKNFDFPYPITYIENKIGSDDMRLVKHCKHDILANSSFSWWGAWLNENPDKIVIAPKMWFADEKENAETDIVPASWLRL